MKLVPFLGCVLVAGCAQTTGAQMDVPMSAGTSRLVFLTREGCVNTSVMRARLDEALASLGWAPQYAVLDLATLPGSDVRRGYPTPTILYDGRDIFGLPAPRPPLPEPT